MALQYREVTGFFTARIPDSGDADLNPDTVPLTGNVAFHPEYRKPLVFPGEHIVLEPINAIIIDGQLMVEVIQNEDVVLQALHLPVTMDERANQTWSWVMRFNGMTLGRYGETVELPDVRFVIEEGDGPLDLSTVPQTTARASSNFITRGETGEQGDPGPGITAISADGDLLRIEWEGGPEVEVEVPTVQGPQGTSVADAVEASPGTVAFRLDDGTTTSAVPLPPGPEGPEGPYGGTEVTDPQVASWINNLTTETGAKIDAAYRTSVSVKEYGAKGDGATDDTDSVQSAMTANPGANILFPPGHYRLTAPLTIPAGTAVSGSDSTSTLLDWSTKPAFDQTPLMEWGSGSLGAPVSLVEDASFADTSLTLGAGHGLEAGDFIRITSDDVLWGAAVKAEFQRVLDSNAETVELSGPVFDSYPVAHGGRVQRAALTSGSLRGVSIQGKGINPGAYGDNAIHFTFAADVQVSDVKFRDIEHRCIVLESVLGADVDSVHFRFDASRTPLQYGVAISGASQNIMVRGCSSWNDRHMVTTNHSGVVAESRTQGRGIPRLITVTGCTSHGSWQCPVDTHQGGEYVTVVGNALNTESTGIKIRGKHALISGNVIVGKRSSVGGTPAGVRLSVSCDDVRITGNSIRGFEQGVRFDMPSGETRALVVSENQIVDCVYAINLHSESLFSDITIRGNTLRPTPEGHGIRLLAPVEDLNVSGNVMVGGHTGIYSALTTHTIVRPVIQANTFRGQSSRPAYLMNVSDGVVASNHAPGREFRFHGSGSGTRVVMNLANIVDTSVPGVDQQNLEDVFAPKWSPLTVRSGFSESLEGYPLQYCIVGKRVWLRGHVERTDGGLIAEGSYAVSVPVAGRPKFSVSHAAGSFGVGAVPAQVDIATNGVLEVSPSGSAVRVSLDGIAYDLE